MTAKLLLRRVGLGLLVAWLLVLTLLQIQPGLGAQGPWIVPSGTDGRIFSTATGADSLKSAGGITAGTGSVGIVNTAGKLPALTTTYLANLDGSALTNISTTQLPAGMAAFFTSACPTGWSEHVPAQGRYLVARAAAGTIGGTVGTALTNTETRDHTHTGPSHTHAGSSHTHGAGTLLGPSHGHGAGNVTSTAAGAHDHGGTTGAPSASFGFTEGGSFGAATDTHTHGFTTASVANHTHGVPSYTTGLAGTGSVTGSTAADGTGATGAGGTGATGGASTTVTAPYIQLNFCTKD